MKFTGKVPNTLWKTYLYSLFVAENPRYRSLSSQEGSYISTCSTLNNVHLLPQRSEEWKQARRSISHNIVSTASTIGCMLGLYEPLSAEAVGIPSYMASHEKVLSLIQKEPPLHSESTEINFSWGNEHESNGLKTLLDSDYLNMQYPGFTLEESGLWPLDICNITERQSLVIGASFDGILIHNGNPIGIAEIKCPSPFIWDKELQEYRYRKPIPYRYIYPLHLVQTQIQLLIAEHLFLTPMRSFFASWTPTGGTSLFDIKHYKEYTYLMCILIERFRDEFLSKGIEPCENYWHQKEHPVYTSYQRFLSLTRELSTSTSPITTVSSFVQGGGNLFLDE